jgi:PAS domain-containing protein
VADQAAAIVSDPDGEIVSWNSAAEALLGCSAGGGPFECVLMMLVPEVSAHEDVPH